MNIRSLLRQPVLTVAIHEREARWTLGRGGRIAGLGRVMLPAGLIDDGLITDVGAVARALSEAGDFPGTGRMQTVVALPAARSVFRQMQLPHVQGKAFAEFVAREIRRELPMVADNTYVSWRLIDAVDGIAQIFVIGVARDVLDSHVAALEQAGLAPISADLRVIAAARAIGRPTVVVAHIEEREIELGVFHAGVPSIVRFAAITAPPHDPAWAGQIGQELSRALKFLRDTRRDQGAEGNDMPVYLVGAGARTPGIAEEIARTLENPVLPATLSDALPEPEALRFAANLGAAMKDLAA
jgi:Tfp pilus assembly PilM family ATPase